MNIKIIAKNAFLKIKVGFSFILNIFLPPICIKCKRICSDAHGLCSSCFSSILFTSSPYCSKCGMPRDEELEEWGFCPHCVKRGKVHFDKARFAVCYDNNISPLILGLKYGDKTCMVPLFAKWMSNAGEDVLRNADFLIPVPLHILRTVSRRYNQSALLALEIGKIRKIPTLPRALKRTKNTLSQGEFSHKLRKKNVRKVFQLNPKYQQKILGKTIVLIDDVITTGATLSECAKVLKKAGAKRVYVLTLSATTSIS